jgi:hypothetical protein
MKPQEKARQLRPLIVKASASLSDEDALEAVELFAAWAVGATYAQTDRVRYGDKLYRCEQTHDAQAAWTPDATPALWTEVALPGEIPVWRQPTGAQDAYQTGDKVHYPNAEGDVWVSTMDANVYEPGVYGWERDGA